MTKDQAGLAGGLTFIMAGLFGGGLYLAFVFPKTIVAGAAAGRDPSMLPVMVLKANDFCVSFGFLMLPALFLGFIASLAWFTFSLKDDS